MSRFKTYTAYSIGSALVWGLILVAVVAVDPPATFHTFLLVSLGWWIGWLSASIARMVYPPPPRRRQS